MKGYVIPSGYMGLVGRQWILFATETEYYEYVTGKRRQFSGRPP